MGRIEGVPRREGGESEINDEFDYYSNYHTRKVIFEALGWEGVVPPLLISDQDLKVGLLPEYLAVSSKPIAESKVGRAPARSIRAEELPSLLNQNPKTEIFQSFWQKDAEFPGIEPEKLPSRTLFLIDIEYYSKVDPSFVLNEQHKVFELLEPTYQGFAKVLEDLEIPFMSVMSGRGWHFLFQVPWTSPAMYELIEVGHKIESGLAEKQKNIPLDSKRKRPVPVNTQLAHQGAAFLVHFLCTRVIRRIRLESEVPINISDVGPFGISVDLTPMMLRPVDGSVNAVPGSLYLKLYVKPHSFGGEGGGRILTRVIRANSGCEVVPLSELLIARWNYAKAVEILAKVSGKIPDASEGVLRLAQKYKESNLRKLHTVLLDVPIDDPSVWDRTYRNYFGIVGNDPKLGDLVSNANDRLLTPEGLDYALNRIFENWGGERDLSVAAHVYGFLRSVYEDPRFNWGKRFFRHYPASLHALGWTAIILGQRFEED